MQYNIIHVIGVHFDSRIDIVVWNRKKSLEFYCLSIKLTFLGRLTMVVSISEKAKQSQNL